MRRTACLLIFIAAEISSAQLSYSSHQNDGADIAHTNTHAPVLSIKNIQITGTPKQQQNFMRWLDGIAETEKGRQTLTAIIHSNHSLHIKHSETARLSAGRTIAPLTEDLINGRGAGVKIIFDANMKDSGSHQVYNEKLDLIEFTAYHNLFHELAHAAHQMSGTWRYFASEQQAIEEENIFRRQLAHLNNETPTNRYGKWGEEIR